MTTLGLATRIAGHDPYSASKAAAAHQTPHLAIATARAGNVIGGGDWGGAERIVPNAMRALAAGDPIPLRNPAATRPWQHVLEPLGGYLLLAERLLADARNASAFKFGPALEGNRSVRELVEAALQHWPGTWRDGSDPHALHEAGRLHL